MRVCILCPYFYPLYGGPENQALQVCQHILRSDDSFEFTVVTRRLGHLPSRDNLKGIEIHRLGSPWLARRAPRLAYFFFLFLAAVFFMHHRESFDVIHSLRAYGLGSLAALLGRFFRKPVIVKIAEGELRVPARLSKRIIRRFRLVFLRRASALVCLNDESESALRSLGVAKERISRIPNGVDTERFKPLRDPRLKADLRESLGLPTDGQLVIFVGYMHPRKGLESFFAAWPEVSAQHKDGHLILVGPLPKKGVRLPQGFLRSFRRFSEVDAGALRVIWTGGKENVEDFLRASDIFVLPSRYEGLPNALLEAMATGLPCLATRIPGIEEVITDGLNGVLLPPENARALTTGLGRLLSMEPECLQEMGDRARMHINSRHSIARVARRYVELYEELVRQSTEAG